VARNRVSDAQIKLYEEERQRSQKVFADHAQGFLNGESLSTFKSKMQRDIKTFYIRTALIAKGKNEFTERDRYDLQRFLALKYQYLNGFVLALESYKELRTDQGVTARAASYGWGWGVFSRYTLPGELADLLPDLPGTSCLGGESCGCFLEYEFVDGEYHVYWYVNGIKEHCPICIDLSIDWSPYIITKEELVEEYGDEVLDEDGEFIEF